MKNVTVSVDEETYRLARIRAAELDTSVSTPVRDSLRSLVGGRNEGPTTHVQRAEPPRDKRRRLLHEVLADFRVRGVGLRARTICPKKRYTIAPRHGAEAEADRDH